ncbi:AfsR/SARP family transcriptional regulator [Micromonospora chokoriensis]
MRYEILGPVRITVGGESPPVGTHKMEALLRTLLIRNGQVVSLDQLSQELWDKTPPARAVAALHVYVSQLRKALNKYSSNADVITTRAPGYMLELGRDELDVDLFLALREKGRMQMSMSHDAAAARTLSEAIGVWREPVQAATHEGPIVREFANWVEELRVDCMELLAHALLASDQAGEAIRILYPLITEYPLRENPYALLMEALSLAGRRADALKVYRMAHKRIREELGLEPCRLLREAHEYILDDRLDELSVRRSRREGDIRLRAS